MTGADYLAALRTLPLGTLADLTGGAPFLVLSPHPDDETLGCGGLLMAAAEAGQGTAHVAILTDGSGSHPQSRAYPAERLVTLRRAEAQAATAVLGLPADRLRFLDMKDTAAPTEGSAFDDAVSAIAGLARQAGARTLFVTSGLDPHCDHAAAFLMARAAVARLGDSRLWAYPVWSWHLDPSARVDAEPATGYRLDIARQSAGKRQALACYASQMSGLISDDPGGFRFTRDQLAPFLGDFEYFVEVTA